MDQYTKQSVEKEQNLVVITTYPPRGVTHHKSVLGGASYTKNMLINLRDEILARGEKPVITVLAQKLSSSPTYQPLSFLRRQGSMKHKNPLDPRMREDDKYIDEGIEVNRMWKRNSLLTFFKLFWYILLYQRKTKTVMIQLELTSFGGNGLYLVMVAPFLFSLRLLNKKVIVVYHEVIADINTMAAHVNLQKHSWRSNLMNFMLRLYYQTTLGLSQNAIVFEEVLKRRLGNSPKVRVIPIAVEFIPEKMTRLQARKQLGIPENKFVVMTFGFLAWYKGTDWLVKAWPEKSTQLLIVAGGTNPNRADLPFYQQYVKRIENESKAKGIMLTGFIPEAEMAKYFLAADTIVFPYRTLMSSSAVISLAFSFQRPLLFSNELNQIFMTKDIKDTLKASGLAEKDILFPIKDDGIRVLANLEKNTKLRQKITKFSQKMSFVRSWKHIRKDYYSALFGGTN